MLAFATTSANPTTGVCDDGTITVNATGGPLLASICWTDPAGQINTGTINLSTPVLVNDLDMVSLTSPRQFKSRQEYLRYRRFLRYAAIVYPYAKEAIIDEYQTNPGNRMIQDNRYTIGVPL